MKLNLGIGVLAGALGALLLGSSLVFGAAPNPGATPEADDELAALLREAAADEARNNANANEQAPTAKKTSLLRGYAQAEMARAFNDPAHWSKLLGRVEFGTQGKTESGLKWKVSARTDYDAVFGTTSYFADDVRRDQQANFYLRENYVDIDAGNWEVRLGRQHVVWGEMVGLFFADVVSARDMREFILPDFNILRIPQWAARAEYFQDKFKGELLWIPVATYDETGKPGASFFPLQPEFPGLGVQYRGELKPKRGWQHGNYGLRGTWIDSGLDLSAFLYSAMDASPTFYRTITPTALAYQARHDRIYQAGGTVAKDFGNFVLKGEWVYTKDRKQTVLRPDDSDGVVPQNTMDWVLSVDVPFESETRLNVQVFQSVITNYDRDVLPKKQESGYSILLNGKIAPTLEAEVMWISSAERSDWIARQKLIWAFDPDWRATFGADIFKGPASGLFGRFDAQDRVFLEVKRSF